MKNHIRQLALELLNGDVALMPKTPCYIYSEAILQSLWDRYSSAMSGIEGFGTHFAMKSNNNSQVLKFFQKCGIGVDVVSQAEAELAFQAGFKPAQIVFSGVGKTKSELRFAIEKQIGMINVESAFELNHIEQIAKDLKVSSPVQLALRVNPNVEVETHPYIATGLAEHKFGIELDEAFNLYLRIQKNPQLCAKGIGIHIGSQMLQTEALHEALEKTLQFAERLKSMGIMLKVLDVGGGIGVTYDSPYAFPKFEKFGEVFSLISHQWKSLFGQTAHLIAEPGRCLIAQAGVLLTSVIGIKETTQKSFLVLDAGMTDLIRPALYQALHPMVSLKSLVHEDEEAQARVSSRVYDVVGPICESSDVFAAAYQLDELHEDERIFILCAGAYGRVMSSQYNARTLPAEHYKGA